MRQDASSRRRHGLLLAVVLLGIFASYAPALRGAFVWDDKWLIERHPAVHELHSPLAYLGHQFWDNPEYTEVKAYYRPLVSLSFALDWALWDGDPRGFHATNLALHLLCCGLVFGLCRRAGAREDAAAIAALLFGLMPRLTESAAWISGRTDLFGAAGALGAWLLHRSERGAWPRRAGAAAVLFVGLLGKEVAFAGAVAIAATEAMRAWRGQATRREALVNAAPMTLAVAGYLALRASVVQSDRLWHAAAGFPWADRTLFALQALGTYARMLLDPLRPSLEIGTLGVVEGWALGVGIAVAGLAAGAGVALVRRARSPWPVAAAALSAAALLPVLHLLPLPLQSVASDRFLYLPLAGLAVLAAAGASRLGPRGLRAAAVASLLAVPAFGVATIHRAALYDDELALWRHELPAAPPLGIAVESALAHVLYERDAYAEALPHFEEALRRRQAVMAAYPEIDVLPAGIVGNLALCRGELGHWQQALPVLEQLVKAQPDAPLNRFNLALAHARLLHFDAADAELAEALRMHPGFEAAAKYRETLHDVRRAWQALPQPTAHEATRVVAARAVLFARLGNRAVARQLFAEVVAAADAEPEDVRRAALYLVFEGEEAPARRALKRLAALPGRLGEARELAAALEARLAERAETAS